MKFQLTQCPIVLLVFLAACGSAGSTQQSAAAPAMPALHQIKSYTFEAPYSCDGSYAKSALFLSEVSKQQNDPDLLFNGACGSRAYIEAATAGDDFSLISDVGDVSLESLSASKSFNYIRVVGGDNTFHQTAEIVAGHSYVVLVTKQNLRALFAINVKRLSADGKMDITYAVKSYSVQSTTAQSPGFDWERPNK